MNKRRLIKNNKEQQSIAVARIAYAVSVRARHSIEGIRISKRTKNPPHFDREAIIFQAANLYPELNSGEVSLNINALLRKCRHDSGLIFDSEMLKAPVENLDALRGLVLSPFLCVDPSKYSEVDDKVLPALVWH